MNERMPVLFIGHGSPNITRTSYSTAWAKIGHCLPLLYPLGLRDKDDQVSFPVSGNEKSTLSMLAA